MMGSVVLMFFSGFLLGWSLSSKLNNRILKHQNKYLKERIKLLRYIWEATGRKLPKKGE